MKKPNGKQVIIISYISFACIVACAGAALGSAANQQMRQNEEYFQTALESIMAGKDAEENTQTGGETTKSPEDTKEPVTFTVKELDGKIAIYGENDKLIKVIDVYVMTLPKADREMLKEGIKVTTEYELYSLIQDYMS